MSFIQRKIKILGYVVSQGKASLDPDKVASRKALPLSETAKELSSLLGLATFCRDYVPKFADLAAVLEKHYHTLSGVRSRNKKRLYRQ